MQLATDLTATRRRRNILSRNTFCETLSLHPDGVILIAAPPAAHY